MKRIIIAFVFLAGQGALAQGSYSSTKMRNGESDRFSVLLLGDAVLLKGAGVKATYKITDKLTVGALGKKYQIENKDDSARSWKTDSKHDFTTYGITADYFPNVTTGESGLYLSGALTSAHLETKVEDTMFGKGESSDDRIGGQVMVGYQFVAQTAIGAKLLFQLGLGYGNGGGAEYKMFTGQDTKIKDSLLFDLSAGAQF